MRLIDDILTEWSYRVHDGIPNMKNAYHLVQLEHILYEKKIPGPVIDIVLKKLREVDLSGKPCGVGQNAQDTNCIPADKSKSKPKKKKKKQKPPVEAKNMDVYQLRAYMGWKNRTQKAWINGQHYLTQEEKDLMKEFDDDLKRLLLAKSDDEKKQILEGMVEKYGLRMNASGSKLYIGAINFDARHIFSGENGNAFSRIITGMITDLGVEVQQPESGSDSPKQLTTNASKIDYNKETTNGELTEIKYEDDEVLQEILNKKEFEPLENRPHFKKVWAPRGKDGKMIQSGGKNNKIHLDFSIENDPTLDNLINQLDELEQSHNISPKCKQAVE